MKISKTSMFKIRKLFVVAMIMFVTISFSLNSVSAQETTSDKSSENNVGEILKGKDAKKYVKAVEKNNNFKDITSSAKLVKKNIKVEKFQLDSTKDFDNDIVIVQTKIDHKKEHTGILAIVDAKTYEVFSFTKVENNDDSTGMLLTEYDGETGQTLLENNVVDGKVVNAQDDSQIEPMAIKKGSFWWKVICNLATSGSCSLGCLSLIAVPGGYPACTLLCGALTGATAC